MMPMISHMRFWILLMATAALVTAAIGCERTVVEPGETQHGGIFLHSSVPSPTTR